MFLTGLFLGVLIGIISGIVFLVLFKSLVDDSKGGASKILKLTGEILALPAFCFGGPWIAGEFITNLFKKPDTDVEKMVQSYVIFLVVAFVIMVIYPLFRWVIKFGEDLGKGVQ